MMKPTLTDAQFGQLQLLARLGAVSPETAVDRHAPRTDGLNMVMLGVALFSRKLVERVEKKAQYGDPKRRLYYMTAAGALLLRRGQA
ncbi:MAG: hypothetical protein JWP35_3515 [Caulobacter sp.]|nr:hypothetical protein [Caulobacter sp.]